MAKMAPVFVLENDVLRAVRLANGGADAAVSLSAEWRIGTPPESSDDSVSDGENADPLPEEAVYTLPDAFAAAAERFKTRECVLALPLTRVLSVPLTLPAESADMADERAVQALAKLSPFPDEELVAAVEVTAETEHELSLLAAALPETAADEIGEALESARLCVVRTDITALGRLREYWGDLTTGPETSRRLVLMEHGGEWDCFVLDEGAPVVLRGFVAAVPADVVRETTFSVFQCPTDRDIGDVVLVTARADAAAFAEALAGVGPVRVVGPGSDFRAAEGCARRLAEGTTFDATPAAWRLRTADARASRNRMRAMAAAGALWLMCAVAVFGGPVWYGHLTDRVKAASKAHEKAYRTVRDMRERVKLVRKYSDHSRGALEMLLAASQKLPEGVTLTSFQFKRDEKMSVQGNATDTALVYAYKDRLSACTFPDGTKMFPSVKLTGPRHTKNGESFTLDLFPQEEETP